MTPALRPRRRQTGPMRPSVAQEEPAGLGVKAKRLSAAGARRAPLSAHERGQSRSAPARRNKVLQCAGERTSVTKAAALKPRRRRRRHLTFAPTEEGGRSRGRTPKRPVGGRFPLFPDVQKKQRERWRGTRGGSPPLRSRPDLDLQQGLEVDAHLLPAAVSLLAPVRPHPVAGRLGQDAGRRRLAELGAGVHPVAVFEDLGRGLGRQGPGGSGVPAGAGCFPLLADG